MSNSLLVLVYVLVVLSGLALTAHTNLGEWAKYKEQYGKVYTRPEEDAKRFALFSNAKKYEQLDKFNNPNGLDRYSDWTPKEIARLWQNDFEYSVREQRLHEIDPYVQALLDDPAPIPAEIDWRQVPNRVSPVARSRGCGCCWAFSAIGMLEGQQVARNFSKNLVPLSVQQLVDCSGLNDGCGGGYSILALVDIERLGGIQSAEDYPYTGVQATECQFDKSKSSVMTISGALYLPRYDLNALKKIVANYGPVAIALGTNKNFMEYTSGIFRDPTCEPKMSHAVLVVGYGNDTKEGDYWIIKNSWGEKWGEEGFMRIKSDQCGIGKISIIAKFNK